MRDAAKYHTWRVRPSLPALRRRLKADLAVAALPARKSSPRIVTLLEETHIRIGNEDYAKAMRSFGLTTLRNRHVRVKGESLRFMFKGKSGKTWNWRCTDQGSRIVRCCQDCRDSICSSIATKPERCMPCHRPR